MSRWAWLFYYTRCTQFESLAQAGKFRKAAFCSPIFPNFTVELAIGRPVSRTILSAKPYRLKSMDDLSYRRTGIVRPLWNDCEHSCCDRANFETLSAADGKAFLQC